MAGFLRGSRGQLAVLAFFMVLALLVTWPLAQHFSDRVLSWAVGDNYEYLWKMWWFKHTLLETRADPLVAPNIAYPYGFRLAHAELVPLVTVLGLPLTKVFGEIPVYNLFMVLSYAVSGWATYALIHRLTRNVWAGLLGGIAFALTPYHVVRTGGIIPLASVEGIPLFFLGFEVWVEKREWRWALISGIGYAIAAWSSLYYAVALLFLAPVYACMRLGPIRAALRDRKTLATAALMLAVAAASVIPVLIPYWQLGQQVKMKIPLYETDFWSASLTDYLLPPGLHPLWGQFVSEKLLSIPEDHSKIALEFILGVGYVTLLFAFYGWRAGRGTARRAFVVLVLVAGILSLGPRVHVGRHPLTIPASPSIVSRFHEVMNGIGRVLPSHESFKDLEVDGLTVPLPALALRWLLPPLLGLRGWNRFAVFVAFGLSVLAGSGLASWMDREWAPEGMPSQRRRRRRVQGGLAVLLLACFELWPAPIALAAVEPRPVDLWLAQQTEQFTIMELPLVSALSAPQMQYTRYHGKRIAFAYGTYYPYWYRESFPELKQCPDVPCLARLREWDVRYVLLNLRAPDAKTVLEEKLRASPDLEYVIELGDISVFRLLPQKGFEE